MKRPPPINFEKKLNPNDFIVSRTDTRGIITYGNEIFIAMSEYSEEELLGTPHSILRHPDMPRIVFKLLWDTIAAGKEIFAYVKNLSKSGKYYWVYANVTADYDTRGNIIGYYSVRRKPNDKAVPVVAGVYESLLKAEEQGGMEASGAAFNDFLKQQGVSYDELANTLQKL